MRSRLRRAIASCEYRAKITCEITLVMTFPNPSAIKAQISVLEMPWLRVKAVLTNPTSAALHAPLANAVMLAALKFAPKGPNLAPPS